MTTKSSSSSQRFERKLKSLGGDDLKRLAKSWKAVIDSHIERLEDDVAPRLLAGGRKKSPVKENNLGDSFLELPPNLEGSLRDSVTTSPAFFIINNYLLREDRKGINHEAAEDHKNRATVVLQNLLPNGVSDEDLKLIPISRGLAKYGALGKMSEGLVVAGNDNPDEDLRAKLLKVRDLINNNKDTLSQRRDTNLQTFCKFLISIPLGLTLIGLAVLPYIWRVRSEEVVKLAEEFPQSQCRRLKK